MLSMEVAILCPPVTLVRLSGGLLLGLRISVALDGLSFLVALTRVFVARRLPLCTADKVDPLASVFV